MIHDRLRNRVRARAIIASYVATAVPPMDRDWHTHGFQEKSPARRKARRGIEAGTECSSARGLQGRGRVGGGYVLLLAVADSAPHPALFASDLAATFSTTATGHAFSSTNVN